MLAIGDIVERCLQLFGITKERVQYLTGGKDCGCQKRKAAMNEWGYRWQLWLAVPARRLLYLWQSVRYGATAMRLRAAGRHLRLAWIILFSRH